MYSASAERVLLSPPFQTLLRAYSKAHRRRFASLSAVQAVQTAAPSLPAAVQPRPLEALASLSPWHLQCCEPQKAPLRVAVLLSGGVDSSLALALAKAAGHHVQAFYLRIWFQEDFRNFWDECPWEEDLQYAQAVCDSLGVELTIVPLTAQYWDRVIAHCVAEIRAGRTPNPDVLCNSRVKFGAFHEHLAQHAVAFDRIASGHYARVAREGVRARAPGAADGACEGTQRVSLWSAPDAVKDQTYFLAHMAPQQLARTMFPLGHFSKAQTRQLAAQMGLANQHRKDSQGLCFLGKVRFSEFIKEHLGEWPGPMFEEETGKLLATHRGFWFCTIGQRSGLNVGHLDNGPWYVTRKDPRMNAVYVSLNYHGGDKRRDAFSIDTCNWLAGAPPPEVRNGQRQRAPQHSTQPGAHTSSAMHHEHQHAAEPHQTLAQRAAAGSGQTKADAALAHLQADGQLRVRVRHGPTLYDVKTFELSGDGDGAHVELWQDDQGLAPGQFAAFYIDGRCLGSGVIADRIEPRRASAPV